MINWNSRLQNKQSIEILKVAIPFFDVEVGETINMEGLLQAVRPFANVRERKMIDQILQLFQIQNMFSMIQMVQSMQDVMGGMGGMGGMGESSEEGGMDPFEMLSMMMQMSSEAGKSEAPPESETEGDRQDGESL